MDPSESRNRIRIAALLFLVVAGYYWKLTLTRQFEWMNGADLAEQVLPCGFAENMPVALQVVGSPFSENTLLAIGREFQAHTDWHKRRPPL